MTSHGARADQRTLEQKRAEHALNRVKEVEKRGDVDRVAYRSYTERLASSIVANGLGQALATELAAGGERESNADKKAHALLYQNLSDWLCDSEVGVYRGATSAIDALVTHDQQAYARAQVESLAWLEWHKKFCQAMLPRREER